MTHVILCPLMVQGLKDESPEVKESAGLGAFWQTVLLKNNEEVYNK